jgi:hypothetical protein
MKRKKSIGIEEEDFGMMRVTSQGQRSNNDAIVLAVNRIIDGLDVDLDALQKGASAGMLLSIDRLTTIISDTADDDLRIKAVNSLTAIANHVIRRRELALEEGGSITVNVSANHVPPKLPDGNPGRLLDE